MVFVVFHIISISSTVYTRMKLHNLPHSTTHFLFLLFNQSRGISYFLANQLQITFTVLCMNCKTLCLCTINLKLRSNQSLQIPQQQTRHVIRILCFARCCRRTIYAALVSCVCVCVEMCSRHRISSNGPLLHIASWYARRCAVYLKMQEVKRDGKANSLSSVYRCRVY